MSDSVAGRAAVYYRKHDGYSQNTLLDERLDDQDSYAVRGSLLFQPTDALDIHVVADFSHNESNGQSRRAVDDPSVPGLGAVVASGLLSDNVRESDAPWTQWEDQDTAGLTARFDYRLGAGHTLTYLSAVRYGDFNGRYSLVGTRLAAVAHRCGQRSAREVRRHHSGFAFEFGGRGRVALGGGSVFPA